MLIVMEVADQLRSSRIASGLTQAETAARASIAASVLSAYENGRREPGASVFLRIMAVTNSVPTWRRVPDAVTCGQRLEQVLSLAEALPYRVRPMARAKAPWTT